MVDPIIITVITCILVCVAFWLMAYLKKWIIEKGPCISLRPVAYSRVPGHEGPCVMTWNGLWSLSRLDGGVTGFFRNTKRFGIFWVSYGPEFHGIAFFGTDGKTITSTAGRY